MAGAVKAITFVVPGTGRDRYATRGADGRGRVEVAVRVGTQRAGGKPVRVTARPGEDVVVLTIANGPALVLHPEDARDLMLAQSASITRSALAPGGRGAAAAVEVIVPAQLGWPGLEAEATRGATRGWMGQVLLSGFHVLTGLAKDPAERLAAAAITRRLDGAVEAGVYRLSADRLEPLKGSGRRLDAVPAAADGGPLLVLVHGTFVDTAITFGKLWTQHNATVRELFGGYADRVYALDHPTLGQSPIANALTLVQALPAGARLHLVTHSRGGLVAEVLARATGADPLAPAALALFADPAYAQHASDLRALVRAVRAKALRVERVVRVACPARGTLLASRRLDAYLSILKWALELAAVPVAPQLVDFLHEVARRRADPTELPGLEAMMPGSPVVAWLNLGTAPIAGELRVVAGDMEGDSIGSWVKTLLADAFYWTDNDLVVQTRSMYGGAPRAPTALGAGASFLLDRGGKVSHFNYFANERTVEAIAHALLDDRPADFAAIGPLSWAGEDASGTRAARAVARSSGGADAAGRPAVFVLPGILGSNLKRDGKRIWLGLRFVPNGLKQLAWDPASAARVEPDGPIDSVYGALIERLADSHEVIAFAFDWRRPIEDEARRLADAVDAALAVRAASAAAGAHPRPLDGRPGRAHDGAREARHLAAHDGARRRAPAHARHAERRLVVADADALGRRHLRQRADRLRLALRRPRCALGDGRHARLPAAAGRAARPGARPRAGGELAEARRRGRGADHRAQPSGTSRASSRPSTNGARRRRQCSTRQWHCAAASTPRHRRSAPMRRSCFSSSATPPSRRAATPSATPASNTSTRLAAATAACRSPARSCPACGPGSSTPAMATCRAWRAHSPPTSSCCATARRSCSIRSRPPPRAAARRPRRRRPRRARCEAGRRTACCLRSRPRARPTSSGRCRGPRRAPRPRAWPCTCRCSTPTSSSCTSRSSSATTARWC